MCHLPLRAPLVALAVLCLIQHASAPDGCAATLTLADARQRALANLPAVEAAREQERASRLRRESAGRLSNPTLGLDMENFGLGLGGSRLETTVQMGQVFDLGGDRSARVAIADAHVQAGAAGRRVTERDAMLLVDERFIAAWSLQEEAGVRAAFVDLAAEAADLAAARHRAGAAPRGEVLRAEAEHAVRLAESRRAAAERGSALQRLAAILGGEPAADSLLLELDPGGASADTAAGFDLARHPDQLAADAAASVAEAEARLVRSSRTPDLEFGLGVRHLEEAGATGLVASVSTALPFWNSGGENAEAAEAESRAARLRSRGLARSLDVELASARTRLATALEFERSLREEVRPAVAGALEQIEVAYRAGRVSGLEPIEARRALRDVELTMVEARAEVARTRADLSRWVDSTREGANRPEDAR